MTYILQLISGGTFIITKEQKAKIESYIENGLPKVFHIGDNLVVVHQIGGIYSMDTYMRQMKMKLSEKNKRMCRKCGTITERSEACPCKDKPEKYPDILEEARKENPTLAAELDKVANQKLLS